MKLTSSIACFSSELLWESSTLFEYLEPAKNIKSNYDDGNKKELKEDWIS